MSVLVSLLVLITMAWSVYRQTEFNKFQKKINQAGFEPSIDIDILPVDSQEVATAEGSKLKYYSYVMRDTVRKDYYIARYRVKNLSTSNLYRLKSGAAPSLTRDINLKNTNFSLVETTPPIDLAPGVTMTHFVDFPLSETYLRHGFEFYVIFRMDFENTLAAKYRYYKAYKFQIYTKEKGRGVFEYWILETVDQQAEWSRLLPDDSLK